MIPTRRRLIGTLACFIAAPAIVRASSLMPVEPTGGMVLAALATAVEEDGGVGYYPALFYKGMLAAAPKEQEG